MAGIIARVHLVLCRRYYLRQGVNSPNPLARGGAFNPAQSDRESVIPAARLYSA